MLFLFPLKHLWLRRYLRATAEPVGALAAYQLASVAVELSADSVRALDNLSAHCVDRSVVALEC